MADTPTTPASVVSRITDEEILKLAEQYELTASQTVATDSIRKHYTNSAAVLRDYVRLRNENAQLKARLEAVVKECEKQMPDELKIPRMKMETVVELKLSLNAVLRAARGEGGAE